MSDRLCTAEFFITRSRDTQANLHIVCSSHTREPTIFRADEARRMRNRLGQMLNTSIRVWSSFFCMLAPSSLVRVILSVNYSIVWVKITCKPSQGWKEHKKASAWWALHVWGEKNSLTGETYSTSGVSVHRVNIIRYNTTSCSSVAMRLWIGRAGAQDNNFSLNRLYSDASLMLKVCHLVSWSAFFCEPKQYRLSCVLQPCQGPRNSPQSWGPTTSRFNIQPKHASQGKKKKKSYVWSYFSWKGLYRITALEEIRVWEE